MFQINEDRFNAMWPKLSVLARAKPSDKFTLVKGMMQSHIKPAGEIVAVTGSGANDGPVLRMADVGFTMVSGYPGLISCLLLSTRNVDLYRPFSLWIFLMSE